MKKLILLAAAAVCALVLTGCRSGGNYMTFTYDHPDKYTVGSGRVTDTVKHLDIQWLNGQVELRYGTGDALSFTEQSGKALTRETTMHWWLDGDTLRLRFCASGKVTVGNLEKTLIVTLPAGLTLESADITTVSGDIDVPELHAREIGWGTTSGAVSASVYGAERVSVGTVSGAVALEAPGMLDRAEVSSTSGSLEVTVDTVEKLSVETVSGTVNLSARQVERGEIGSTSGAVSLTLADTAGVWEIGTVSGSVHLTVPEDGDLTLEYSTVSGSFCSGIPMRQEGKKTYSAGRGGETWTVSTTSGTLEVSGRA